MHDYSQLLCIYHTLVNVIDIKIIHDTQQFQGLKLYFSFSIQESYKIK